MSREQAPDVWWSPTWELVWSEDGGRTFQLQDGAERFALPGDAMVLQDWSTGCCCGGCDLAA